MAPQTRLRSEEIYPHVTQFETRQLRLEGELRMLVARRRVGARRDHARRRLIPVPTLRAERQSAPVGC